MHQNEHQKANGILYVVATPIGNLQDITLRALDVLRTVDIVAAEDTRITSNLLKHHAIAAKLVAVHAHNERGAAEKLIQQMQTGKSIALVSDAGTPGISDPGGLVVQEARAAGIRVAPIPGANAAIAALSASGILAPHFLFYGFLPHKSGDRRRALVQLKELQYLVVFYESPHRILECLADLHEVLGEDRKITFARELTKIFETLHSCLLGEAEAWLTHDINQQRGEFVLLVEGAAPPPDDAVGAEARHTLQTLLVELPLKQAVKLAAEITGAKKNALYELALQMKKE